MNDLNDGFIRLFEDIAREVNRRAGSPKAHSVEIQAAADRDGLVRKNSSLLHYIRDLRNALQHPKHHSDGAAFQISKAFFDEVQALLNHLRHPPTANSVGVLRKDVRIAGLSEHLGDLAGDMKQHGFTHLPILNDTGAVIGVFNEAAVFDFLWGEPETIISREMELSSIFGSCRLDADRMETFNFVNPGKPLDVVADMFRSVETPLKRVGAVFVTASGKPTEPLQRLITPWDVLGLSSAT